MLSAFTLIGKGVIISTRLERIEVFQDILSWIQEDLDLSNTIPQAKQNTQVFMGDEYSKFR